MGGTKETSDATTKKKEETSEAVAKRTETSEKALSEQSVDDRKKLAKPTKQRTSADQQVIDTYGNLEIVDGSTPEKKETEPEKAEKTPDGGEPASKSENPSPTDNPNMPNEELCSKDVAKLNERNFSRVDSDDDGYLSSTEIDMAVKNREFTGQDAQFVAMLKQRREEISGLFGGDDMDVVESSVITKHDMEKFQQIQVEVDAEFKRLNDQQQFFEKNSQVLDTSGDGVLDASELKQASENSRWTEEERNSLLQLNALREKTGSGITVEVLQKEAETFCKTDNAQLILKANSNLREAGERLKNVNSNLFGTENPLESIRPDAFSQGQVGNCYFMSAMSSLSGTNPQAIKDMIKDNGDGTYTITFPGARDEPITVDKPTDTELSLYAKVGGHGIWPAVMEKAYGKYCNQSLLRRSPLSPFEKIVDQEGGDGGSALSAGLKILTGKGVDSDIMSFTSEEELDAKLKQAVKDGVPIDAGINGEFGAHPFLPESWKLSDNKTDDLGIPCQHEYSVIGYDEERKLVKVRNPWGTGEPMDENGNPKDGVDDGIFEVTLTQFRQNFSSISYGQK